jgi:hypothetical protein
MDISINIINIIIIIFILIIIIFIIKSYYSETTNFENFTMINFLSKSTIEDIIYNDYDKYYDRFYQIDWVARHVNSKDEYINLIKTNNVCSEFNFDEKDRLTRLIILIETNLKDNRNKINLPIELLLQTPWNIGLCNGTIYENGFPHTRNLNIILYDYHMTLSDNNLSKILLHEKIHIFQKAFPDITQQYLSQYNFKIYGKRTHDSMIRVNPDTDDDVYINSNNVILSCKYNSINPSSINDVNTSSQLDEHPLEFMAIDLEKKFL